MSALPKPFLTPEQYLEIERAAEFRSEYFQGEMFAMAGAGWVHNQIVWRAVRHFGNQLASRRCEVMTADQRVRVNATGLFVYPDIVVVCGKPQFLDNQFDTLVNPSLIIEVLSPSTESYDRGRKFEHYRLIESCSEYLLLSTDRISAELFTRQTDGRWLLTVATRMEDTLELQSVSCELSVGAIYDGVDFSRHSAETTLPV